MNILERAKMQIASNEEKARINLKNAQIKNKKLAVAYFNEWAGTSLTERDLKTLSHDWGFKYLLTVDGLVFKITYEKRGYDNLGAHDKFYIYLAVKAKGYYYSKQNYRWEEIGDFLKLPGIVAMYGIPQIEEVFHYDYE